MNILLKNELDISKYEGLIIPMYEEELMVEGIKLPLEQLKASKRFEGKVGNLYKMTLQEKDTVLEILLVGLGKRGEIKYRKLLNKLADAYRMIKEQRVTSVAITLNNSNLVVDEDLVRATVEASIMGDYKFDTYLSKKDEKEEIKVDLILAEYEKFKEIIEESRIVAKANIISRDLVNEPANVLTPVTLAQKVVELGDEKGFEVEVLGIDEITELGMEAYLAVSKASPIEAQFIIMRYKGDPTSEDVLGYVGKGLTYDAGGLSIKPTSSMVTMKSDMGGAAAVIGAMSAIAENKLKQNVTAVVAACENVIDGYGYKPGDIINSMGGKTIYIGNTDAEGRLTLIDAMHYIVTKEKVNKVVDVATLTGAALHCTGDAASPAISNDDSLFKAVDDSFSKSGEQIWRMPIFDEYKELIKHSEADLTNTAGRPGTITAGLFIGEFNGDIPWVHIDIAGTSWSAKQTGIFSKGATGEGARSLYYLAKEN